MSFVPHLNSHQLPLEYLWQRGACLLLRWSLALSPRGASLEKREKSASSLLAFAKGSQAGAGSTLAGERHGALVCAPVCVCFWGEGQLIRGLCDPRG